MSEEMFGVEVIKPTRKWLKKPESRKTGFYYAVEIKYVPAQGGEPIWSTITSAAIVWRKSEDFHTFEAVKAAGLENYARAVVAKWNSLDADVCYTLLTQQEYDAIAFGLDSLLPMEKGN